MPLSIMDISLPYKIILQTFLIRDMYTIPRVNFVCILFDSCLS
jgi:hypothetical protein